MYYTHASVIILQGLQNIPRQSYYLTTKVGRYLPDPAEMFDFRAERVIKSVDESLERLGLTYIDVIQVCIMKLNATFFLWKIHGLVFKVLDREYEPFSRNVYEFNKTLFRTIIN